MKKGKAPSSFEKTYMKTILREIRGSFGRFIAIFAIVALGVGFLAGLLATTPDMKLSVDRYYRDNNMTDLFIKATMGLTEEDLRAVEALEDVDSLMPAYVMDLLVRTSQEETLTARIYGLPLEALENPDSPDSPDSMDKPDSPANRTFINRLDLIRGRMPQNPGECLVQQPGGYLSEIEPGTVLTVSPENLNHLDIPDLESLFHTLEFTVTGVAANPFYFSNEREPSPMGNGRLGAVIYVPREAYALDAYTDFYISLDGAAKHPAFSGAYDDTAEAAAEKIKALGKDRSRIRHDEILRLAQDELGKARDEYGQARTEADSRLAEARTSLDAGWQEVLQGEADLSAAALEIEEGALRLARERTAAERELRENEDNLRNGEAEITRAKATLDEAKTQLDAAAGDVARARSSWFARLSSRVRRQLEEYDQGLAAWEEGAAAVAENEALLDDGWKQLEEGRRQAREQFAAAEAELEAGREEIAAGRKELEKARSDLAAGETEYSRARTETAEKLDDAARQITAAGDEIRKIGTPEWYVLDRNANVSYVNYKANAEKIADVAKVFPIFFLLVAALVALTTMTRMVEEERTQIGILKALGYRKRVIASKYLIYCGLTSVLGSLVGMVSGFRIIPVIIYKAFGTMYNLPPLVTVFNWPFGLIACGLVLGCTMGVTIYAGYHSLREKPAALMLPRAPKAGKRIFLEYFPFLWSRMKFSYKSTARNLIRYKKHFFMTVVGIAGCTALMLTGFGLRDSIEDIAHTQFETIFRYDLRIELGEHQQQDRILRNFLASLEETNRAALLPGETQPDLYTRVSTEAAYILAGDQRISASLIVPKEPEDINSFISLRERKTREPLAFTGSSVVLTEKMAAALDLRKGDPLQIENSGGRVRRFILTDITENYVGNYAYLGPREYHAAFGREPDFQTLYIRSGINGQEEQDKTIIEILSSDSVAGAEFVSQVQESYNNLLESISFVVAILIFAAGGLAVIVLYNLTNININERRRELATLRVLGYYQNEVAGYIFREITILSIVGTLAGLLLGIPLHRFVIGVAENVDLMFGRNISSWSFVFSAGATLVFSGLVNLLMIRKIRSIKMVDSMKAAD